MSTLSRDDVRSHLLGDALRRHKVMILVVTLLFTLAVGAAAATRASSYTASAKLLLRPTLGNPFSADAGTSGPQVTIAMQTEAAVVDSAAVATLSSKKLDHPWTAGTGTVVATVLPNTQILQIAYTGTSASAAQKGAQAVASAYLDYRKARTASTQSSRVDILNKQAKAVKSSLDAASKTAAASSAPPEAAQQVQLYANQLVTLQTTIGTLEATGADPGSVVAPAALPTSASGINPLILILAGLVIGLFVGITLAIWRERGDDRVRGESDTSVGTVPVVGWLGSRSGVPFARRGGNADTSRREVIQRVRAAALAHSPAPSALTVAGVASDGSSVDVAVDLATSLARSAYRVVLVVAGGDGAVERRLGISSGVGLSDALSSDRPAMPLLVEASGLRVLTSGSDLGGATELLAGARFAHIVTELLQGADYVIVLAAPASTPSGISVARASDGLLLIGEDRRSTHDDFADVAERAHQLDVQIVGAVLLPRAKRASGPDASPSRPSAGHRAAGRSGASSTGTVATPASGSAPIERAAHGTVEAASRP